MISSTHFLDLLYALLAMGLPMVILSWFLFSWLFESGELGRGDGHKIISSRVKELKKNTDHKAQNKNIVYKKWMWFGSGFYGLAGLWTLVVIEVQDFIRFVSDLSQLRSFAADGWVNAIIDFLISQLGNIVQAFLWFSYWGANSVLIWLAVAYLGYWAGVEIARRHKLQTVEDLRQFYIAVKRIKK